MTRTAGAQIGCQRPSRFWGLGCPKIYHEAEDTLVSLYFNQLSRSKHPQPWNLLYISAPIHHTVFKCPPPMTRAP
ncbi:hypothetical protein, partial [Thiolapillus sp.]